MNRFTRDIGSATRVTRLNSCNSVNKIAADIATLRGLIESETKIAGSDDIIDSVNIVYYKHYIRDPCVNVNVRVESGRSSDGNPVVFST